ncbi:S8 family serine peptidase [Pseudomonas fakonensis]|uniref:S8 family serine peptidase n=1 Tax=Pseudomonas fakonensis TaxID=2842355 RepID=A0ABX8NBS4_9PSED|nr:S8 family serine peptidase [Pseudomonas fakonensis]QXH53444.1 S8 family serine peptidase [Pseudomonas fakonensis]
MKNFQRCGCFALMFTATSVFAEPPPANIEVRVSRPLSDDGLRKYASLVKPRTLDKSEYPDLKQFSTRQVASVLCGSFRTAYVEQVQQLNPGIESLTNVDQVLGDDAYRIQWPGCPTIVEQPDFRYVVRPGDNASALYETFTGSRGSPQAVRAFFARSQVRDLSRLVPGQTLTPGHISLARGEVSGADARAFRGAYVAYYAEHERTGLPGDRSRFIAVNDLPEAAEPPPADGPTLGIAAGRIESVQGTEHYESPPECRGQATDAAVFDAARLTAAYEDADRQRFSLGVDKTRVRVAVADNGFFGARLRDGAVVFGPQFPKRFFGTYKNNKDGQIGPVVITGGNKPVYPINYSNNRDKATYVSGHGTHVTGITLGGPDFQSHLAIFDRPHDLPWLRYWIINVGNGEQTLLANSAGELSLRLNLLQNAVVNLSIQYSAPGTLYDANLLNLRGGKESSNVFVVAAGNDGVADVNVARYYPAMLGGTSQNNIISVAAHRPDGALATFSNRGKNNVDLAAPGCDVPSWLDDSGTVSRVSGTSQAAAVVTFAVSLLKSLGLSRPIDIKNRLMISGDLLVRNPSTDVQWIEAGTEANLPEPGQIYSQARLNIARALYLYDDYLQYRQDGITHEVLGTLQGMTAVRCAGQALEWKNLWALKAGEQGALAYQGKLGPDNPTTLCSVAIPKGGTLKMKLRAGIAADGSIIEPPSSEVVIPASDLVQYVSALMPSDELP